MAEPTSADPTRLDAYTADAAIARGVLFDQLGVVGARAASVKSATVDAPSTHGLDALGVAIENMASNERFVAEVSAALKLADDYTGSGVATLENAGIERRLDRADLLERPGPVDIPEPELYGLVPSSGWSEDPICTSTGNFVHVETDLHFVGYAEPLSTPRTYNSRSRRRGGFGWGWSHVLDMAVELETSSGRASVSLADGAMVEFVPDGSEGFEPNHRRHLWLRRGGDGELRLTNLDGDQWWFDLTGQLAGYQHGAAIVRVERSPNLDTSPDTTAGAEHDWTRLHEERSGRSVTYRFDDGVVSETVSSDGRVARHHYDPGHHLVRVDGASGSRRYDVVDGRIESMADGDGVILFHNSYDEHGRVTTQLSQSGRLVRFIYGATGVTQVRGDDQVVNVFIHDRRGRLTVMTDGLGHALRYEYDEFDRPVRVIDRCDHETRYAYDGVGRPIERVDPDGGVCTWVWDEQNRLVAERLRSGGTIEYEYDGDQAEAAAMVSPAGHRSTVVRNESGLPTELVDADGVRTAFAYNSDGLPNTVTDGGGAITSFAYSPSGLLREIVSPSGASTAVTADEAGRVEALEGPDGVQRFRYSPAGRLVGGTTVEGGDWTAEYGLAGELLSMTDPENAGSLAFTNDSYGRVTSATTDDGATVSTHYDVLSRPVASIDPNGRSTMIAYDPEGRVTSTTDPAGRTVTIEYNELGQAVRITDPADGETTRTYHPDGELATHSAADGASWAFDIDPDGLVVSAVDPTGAQTRYRYSPGGRLVETINPGGRRATGSYDAAGRLASFQGASTSTLIGRRPDGLPSSVTAEASTLDLDYDLSGRLATIVDGRGVATNLEWSPSGRLASISDPAAAGATFSYDLRGLLTEAVDAAGQGTAFRYDGRGRLLEEATGGMARALEHDAGGSLTAVTEADGLRTEIDRDTTGRPELIRTGDTGLAIDWTPIGQPAALSTIDGDTLVGYDYDGVGRLTAITSGDDVANITYDLLGRPTEITSGQSTWSYSWDLDGRLAATTNGEHRVEAAYGDDGNIAAYRLEDGSEIAVPDLEQRRNAERRDAGGRLLTDGERSFGYDRAGRLATATGSAGTVTYRYDDDGLLHTEGSADGEVAYDWDLRGRLTVRRDSGEVTHHAYDSVGRRTWSRTGEVRIDYRWDDLDRLVGLDTHHADGTSERTRIDYGALGLPIRVDGLDVEYDPLSGRVVGLGGARYLHNAGLTYEVGGEAGWQKLTSDDPWSSDESPADVGVVTIGYRGHLAVGGLVFMGARIYDPTSRSFLSPDPLPSVPGAPAYASAYLYAWNDPVNHVDPTGLRPLSDAEYTEHRDSIERGWVQRNWKSTLGWIAAGAVAAVGVALIVVTSPAWITAAGIGILVGGAFALGAGLLSGDVNPWHIAWGGVVGGLSGAAFAAVAPAAGASWTIGSRLSATGVGFSSGFGGDLGTQLIDNHITGQSNSDVNLWRSLAWGGFGGVTAGGGTFLGPKLSTWWQNRRTPTSVHGPPRPLSAAPPINGQQQAGHVVGTPQYAQRIKDMKPTSSFLAGESADSLTMFAWQHGTPTANPNIRIYDFQRPIGEGFFGGFQTQVRVSLRPSTGTIHGSPWGPAS